MFIRKKRVQEINEKIKLLEKQVEDQEEEIESLQEQNEILQRCVESSDQEAKKLKAELASYTKKTTKKTVSKK